MGSRGPPFVFYEFNGARFPQQFLCGSIEPQHATAFPNGIDSGQNRNVIADFRHDNLALGPYSMFISELLRNHQLPLLCNTHSMHYNLRHSVQPIIAELYHRWRNLSEICGACARRPRIWRREPRLKRRGGDSNPRHRFCQCNCLAGSPVRPLQHLSVVDEAARLNAQPSHYMGKPLPFPTETSPSSFLNLRSQSCGQRYRREQEKQLRGRMMQAPAGYRCGRPFISQMHSKIE